MESKFLSPLHFVYGLQVREGLPDSYLTLTTDLVYQSEHLDNTVHIPYGFKSDGASVPKALWKHYPLSPRSKRYCGLNVPANMQIIPSRENLMKSSKDPEEFYGEKAI